jgi:hypothetical protein
MRGASNDFRVVGRDISPASTFVCADLDLGEVEVPMMPSEEEIARMREECAQLGAEEYHRDAHLADLDTSEQQDEPKSGKGRFLSLWSVHEMFGN